VPSENRYCCEAIVDGHKMDVLQVKRMMSGFGDSLVIAGGDKRIRLHMHTNDPESMFSQLQTLGKLSQIKADDMHLQMEAIQEPRSKVAIVTDSIADLPEGFARENQVFVMPMQIEVDGVVHLDRISLSVKRFYEINRQLKEQPKSSLPSIKQVESLLEFLQEHYEAVLVLCVSDKLSGTYEMVASLADLQRKRGQKIAVVNTLKNSGAQGLLVVEACKLARREVGLEAMVEQLVALIPRTQILVAVDTVKYLERSGRVSHNVGKIAKWMNLKPIMTLDQNGKGKAYGGTISYNSVILKIKKAILKDQQRYGIESFNIVHGACLERAEKLSKEMETLLGMPVAYIAEISPIVGAIAGEGAVAVSYICTKAHE
jgi:DegV family protein with EDD domain